MQGIKNSIRKILFSAGIDLTKNQKYDRQTLAIMKKILKEDSNCIDVGCHKGEVMDEILKIASKGKHTGFEPIPEYYEFLKRKYASDNRVAILKNALSDSNGEAEFNWVKNAPAYSGIKQRSYAIKDPQIEKIQVQLTTLDECGNHFPPTSLIKIDVEGAELMVLKGAMNFIQQHRPVIIFEFGLGAADHYGVGPEDVHHYFSKLRYQLNTLKGFLNDTKGLDPTDLKDLFYGNREYYFVAYPV
jgi:FkbM family methyltransferase